MNHKRWGDLTQLEKDDFIHRFTTNIKNGLYELSGESFALDKAYERINKELANRQTAEAFVSVIYTFCQIGGL